MTPRGEEDLLLASRCASGEETALEALVKRFSGLIYHAVKHTFILKRVPHTQQDLEDLHGLVFLHLLDKKCRKLGQYKGTNGCSLASWIRLITIQTVLNHLRMRGMDSFSWGERRSSIEDLHGEMATDGDDVIQKMEKEELMGIIEAEIHRLPVREKLLMRLHFEKGLGHDEIASLMHLSFQNVYTIKHRAIKRLRVWVSERSR
jgi:RNA polymerase sigma-70 factor (ECF subfamily)